MDNGRIKLIATVDEGPRIIFFGFCDGPNVLFEDYERNFYETVVRSWCTLWSPDKKMES